MNACNFCVIILTILNLLTATFDNMDSTRKHHNQHRTPFPVCLQLCFVVPVLCSYMQILLCLKRSEKA